MGFDSTHNHAETNPKNVSRYVELSAVGLHFHDLTLTHAALSLGPSGFVTVKLNLVTFMLGVTVSFIYIMVYVHLYAWMCVVKCVYHVSLPLMSNDD